eukprot:912905-Rhodomonas_salina.2
MLLVNSIDFPETWQDPVKCTSKQMHVAVLQSVPGKHREHGYFGMKIIVLEFDTFQVVPGAVPWVAWYPGVPGYAHRGARYAREVPGYKEATETTCIPTFNNITFAMFVTL